ncbi:pentapeptide repeat-containing protein [Streptomyces sp. NPDC007851]|uniref:pentapeptide repeat-containing protein n=1 Tax=Streptomyces sp. NPDC007851 TaxID=3155008 RepID=UPI0033DE7A90
MHALAGLADDAPTQDLRQTCIDVLCAYLRLPSPPDPGDLPNLPDGTSPSQEQRAAHRDEKDRYHAMREVRHTILRLIGDHFRIPEGAHRSWQRCNLDLTGVTIDGDIDFTGAEFSGGEVSFRGALFSSGEVSFRGAVFSGGRVYVNSAGALYVEGDAPSGRVYVNGAVSNGSVSFDGAVFSGGEVSFGHAFFDGRVSFRGATFFDDRVSFDGAVFSGGRVDFLTAVGPVPAHLLTAVNTPTAAGVLLPPAWLSVNP